MVDHFIQAFCVTIGYYLLLYLSSCKKTLQKSSNHQISFSYWNYLNNHYKWNTIEIKFELSFYINKNICLLPDRRQQSRYTRQRTSASIKPYDSWFKICGVFGEHSHRRYRFSGYLWWYRYVTFINVLLFFLKLFYFDNPYL